MKTLAISASLLIPLIAQAQQTDVGSSSSVLGVLNAPSEAAAEIGTPSLSRANTAPSVSVPSKPSVPSAPSAAAKEEFTSFGPFTPTPSAPREIAPRQSSPTHAPVRKTNYGADNAWRGETSAYEPNFQNTQQTYGRSPTSGRLNLLPKVNTDSDLGYTFIELLYDYTDFHGVDGFDDHGRGYTVRGSYSPIDFLFLNAWVSQSSADDVILDASVELDSISAGVAVGGYLPLTRWFHLTAEVGGMMTENTVDKPNFSFFDDLDLDYEGDDSGFYAMPGVRIAIGNRVELAGQVLFNETDVGDDMAYILKAYLEMIPTCDLALGAVLQDDINRYSLGARFKW